MKETFVTFIITLKSLFLTFIGTLKLLFLSSDPPSLPPSLPFLPFDIVEEILCKLLIQLQCQSKSFNTLISDPQFAKKHLIMSIITTDRHRIILTKTINRLSSSSSSRVISLTHFTPFSTHVTPFLTPSLNPPS